MEKMIDLLSDFKGLLNKKEKSRELKKDEEKGSDDSGASNSVNSEEDINDVENLNIRTQINSKLTVGKLNDDDEDSFYSSSDSEEEQEKKLKFEIKPASIAVFNKNSIDESPINNNLSKSISSFSLMGPPSSILIPRPPSKRNFINTNENIITRCKSYGNLSNDIRMTPVSLTSSRGPSPLTLGIINKIPIAAALQECISAQFKGTDESKCLMQIYGCLKIAFPCGIIQVLTSNPLPALLSFKLVNAIKIEKVLINKDIVIENHMDDGIFRNTYFYDLNMVNLTKHLKKLWERSPDAPYFNVEILKYKLRSKNASLCPLHVVSHWRCEQSSTWLKIDYKYSPRGLSSIQPLKNLSFSTSIDGKVTSINCSPAASWDSETNVASWKLNEIFVESKENSSGSLKAKCDLLNGPTKPSSVSVKFSCPGAIFSGIDFQLNCGGYRISLFKKQLSSGSYISEPNVYKKVKDVS